VRWEAIGSDEEGRGAMWEVGGFERRHGTCKYGAHSLRKVGAPKGSSGLVHMASTISPVPHTRHTPHATRHTPHATRHTPQATRHTPHATGEKSALNAAESAATV
jgi:hypothetical protein